MKQLLWGILHAKDVTHNTFHNTQLKNNISPLIFRTDVCIIETDSFFEVRYETIHSKR